jgi:hypothetical protein
MNYKVNNLCVVAVRHSFFEIINKITTSSQSLLGMSSHLDQAVFVATLRCNITALQDQFT